MKREFLQNFKVGSQALTKEIIAYKIEYIIEYSRR